MSGTMALDLSDHDALIVVDVQNDFLPGGALAVTDGDQVIAPLNRAVSLFGSRGLPVFFSRDWHPPAHCSFTAQGGAWPAHCVAGTPGARFAAAMKVPDDATIVSKGTSLDRDAYSALDGTDLPERLRAGGIRRLYVGGLATDYCVKATVLDALAAGFQVVVLADAIRAVNVEPEDGERAIAAMIDAGARMISTGDLEPAPAATA